MEFKDISKDNPIEELTDEEIEFLTSNHEMGKAWGDIISTVKAYSTDVKAIKDANPKFRGKTLKQLNDDNEFLEALKEYKVNHPSTLLTEPEKIKEALKSIIPEYYYITNNKLSNEMTKDFINQGQIPLLVMKSKKKGDVLTYCSLTYDSKNISITGRYEFTAYDRAIHNAVCSLYVAGNDVITPRMVYRTANGMSDNEKVSPQAIESVKNSLDKSRFLRLKVNFSEEVRARNIDVDKVEIDSYLLPAKLVIVETGGNKVEAYKIYETPALYQYAQHTKQILSVPLELLDTKHATRNTEDIITIKEYLIRRIEVMKYDRTMSNKILYDTTFEEVGIKNPNRDKSYDLRKGIKAILSLWKRNKYIKNFKEYKASNTFKGIEITL